MTEVFSVIRVLQFRVGSRVTFPLHTYATRGEADAQAKELNDTLASLMPLALVERDKGNKVKDSGLTALELLVNLGMTKYDHVVERVEMSERERPALKLVDDGPSVSPGGIIIP